MNYCLDFLNVHIYCSTMTNHVMVYYVVKYYFTSSSKACWGESVISVSCIFVPVLRIWIALHFSPWFLSLMNLQTSDGNGDLWIVVTVILADSRPEFVGLVWGLAAIQCCVCIQQIYFVAEFCVYWAIMLIIVCKFVIESKIVYMWYCEYLKG